MEKHAGHKETVIERLDEIEAEPAHPVAMAKGGAVDDQVVQRHQQRDDGTRAVERCDAPLRRHRQIVSSWYLQH